MNHLLTTALLFFVGEGLVIADYAVNSSSSSSPWTRVLLGFCVALAVLLILCYLWVTPWSVAAGSERVDDVGLFTFLWERRGGSFALSLGCAWCLVSLGLTFVGQGSADGDNVVICMYLAASAPLAQIASGALAYLGKRSQQAAAGALDAIAPEARAVVFLVFAAGSGCSVVVASVNSEFGWLPTLTLVGQIPPFVLSGIMAMDMGVAAAREALGGYDHLSTPPAHERAPMTRTFSARGSDDAAPSEPSVASMATGSAAARKLFDCNDDVEQPLGTGGATFELSLVE